MNAAWRTGDRTTCAARLHPPRDATSATASARRPPPLLRRATVASNQRHLGRRGATIGRAPSPHILRSSDLSWEEAREPLHASIASTSTTSTASFGPGMPFASPSAPRAPSTIIGLVPRAQGGEQSLRADGDARQCRHGHGWRQDGRAAVVLGEADTIRREDAEVYARRMEAMVRDVRRDLALPELLVIQMGIAMGQGKFIWSSTVSDAIPSRL
ncbi:hypothetical protein E2562_002485 [Oryza meyeriana var. granulata]|uniref:Sialate O-acetylesterase domain-containing protein n=1 Tax=Oryza meyeriana var. granulata TaxID=110450 RepID=A0A6G1F2J2_9ORYZ|nr:hypothetical protein E2562_002485 [Oryza meyeriana var. granulata]